MSGIAGMTGAPDESALVAMSGRLRHRGTVTWSVWSTHQTAISQRKLVLRPKASAQCRVHQGNRWIAMDGAIYNQEELRQRLDPPLPPTAGPEEIVLRLYAEEGPDGLAHLEGVFAVAIIDGDNLFLARDPLGVRPLYYGVENGTFYFASEIKALQAATRDVHVFPPGHWYRSGQGFQPYYDLKQAVPEHGYVTDAEWNLGRLERKVRRKVEAAVARRLEPGVPTGVFLSGGLDSSAVAAVVKDQMEEVATFCVGMAGSEDLAFARQVAQHLGTRHHERELQPAELLAALPEVIYHLESFDAPLVRSAVGHYLAAREAQGQVRLMFTGEGADELFAGYKHLQRLEDEAMHQALLELTGDLHRGGLQRVDRMTVAHGLAYRVPFLDRSLVRLSFGIPPCFKVNRLAEIEKCILRGAFADDLPPKVVWRKKARFWEGSGIAGVLSRLTADRVTDEDFARERTLRPDFHLASREELYYYRIFREQFTPEPVLNVMSRTEDP